jgi:hypothetical protein
MDVSPAALIAGSAGAFVPGSRLGTYGALVGGAPAAEACAVTLRQALQPGAPAPPLAGLVFLDPAAFVPGGLAARARFWAAAADGCTDAPAVLRWVTRGACFEEFLHPFTGVFKGQAYEAAPRPPPRAFRNHPSVTGPDFVGFVRAEVAKGLADGGMRCLGPVGVAAPPRVVCPLMVEPSKPRLICDARYSNLWQRVPSFAFDRLLDLVRVVLPGWLLTVWDHKSGYFHIRLEEATQQYFGFEFEGSYYVYTVLPFGWSASPLVYQTVSRVVAYFLRRLGVADFTYLDDSATPAPPGVATHHAYAKATVLTALGFFVHLVKSQVTPAPCQQWLGFLVDLGARVFRVPPAKLARILALLSALLAAERVPVPSLRSFAGKCVSLSPAVPGALLYTRAMFDALAAADRAGADTVPVSGALRGELELWAGLQSWHGTRRWRSERHIRVRVATDASGTGWGGWFVVAGGAPVLLADTWSAEESRLDIGTLEMLAAARALRCLPPAVDGAVVLLDGDNQAMVALLRGGRAARGAPLLVAQRELFSIVLERGLFVDATWLRSEENVVPDLLSRLPRSGEGRLRRDLFLALQRCFGGFSLDALAGAANAQCPRYVTRFVTPGAVASDVFAFPLGAEPLVYAFPPEALIGPVLAYLREQRARAVVVVPWDIGAPWWPLLPRPGEAVTAAGAAARTGPPPPALFLAAAGDESAVLYAHGGPRRLARPLLGVLCDFRPLPLSLGPG